MGAAIGNTVEFIRSGFGAVGDQVLADLEKWVEEKDGLSLETPNYEGVRVNYDLPAGGADGDHVRGWFLLRKSLHDPVMPLNIESENEGGIDIMLPMVLDFIGKYDGISVPQYSGAK